ncbi:LuxR C-terminal-related transcriptional regulator [Chloroflexota bacterium]
MDKMKVVIANNRAVVVEGIRTLLERESDIEVVGEANDGEEVQKLILSLKPDVLLLDASMPKLTNTTVAWWINTASPDTAILVFTNTDDDEYIFGLFQAGVSGYLLEDAHASELIQAVRAVHAGDRVLPLSIARKVIQHTNSHGGKLDTGGQDSNLTNREAEILQLVAKGMTNREIADYLKLSSHTVAQYMVNIFKKLDARSRSAAVYEGVKKGLVSFETHSNHL